MNSPTPPDPYQTANTQQTFNRSAATAQQGLNMVDQSTPYGSTKYSQVGTNPDGTPHYGVDTSFTPVGQQLFDNTNNLKLNQQGLANSLLGNGEGALSGKAVDLSYDGTAANLDKLNHARLDPQWQQNTDQMESKLANQGVTPGTPAYDNAMRVFNQGKNDAYNSANLADYNSATAAKLAQYNSPLQTYSTLVNGTAPPTPNSGNVTTPTTNVASTNYAGLAEQNYQQQAAQNNAMMGGIFGTLGTVGGAMLGGPFGSAAGGALGGMFGGGSNWGAANPGANGSAYYGPVA